MVDHSNDPRWCNKIRSVEQTGERMWTVTQKPVPLRPTMILALEHLEADAPKFLKLREEDDVSVFNVTYRLEADEQGTRFTQISEFEWKKLPSVLHRTFARGYVVMCSDSCGTSRPCSRRNKQRRSPASRIPRGAGRERRRDVMCVSIGKQDNAQLGQHRVDVWLHPPNRCRAAGR